MEAKAFWMKQNGEMDFRSVYGLPVEVLARLGLNGRTRERALQ